MGDVAEGRMPWMVILVLAEARAGLGEVGAGGFRAGEDELELEGGEAETLLTTEETMDKSTLSAC